MSAFTLQLDENDLAVIAAGLGELPLKVSKATFDRINAQVAEQSADRPPANQNHEYGTAE